MLVNEVTFGSMILQSNPSTPAKPTPARRRSHFSPRTSQTNYTDGSTTPVRQDLHHAYPTDAHPRDYGPPDRSPTNSTKVSSLSTMIPILANTNDWVYEPSSSKPPPTPTSATRSISPTLTIAPDTATSTPAWTAFGRVKDVPGATSSAGTIYPASSTATTEPVNRTWREEKPIPILNRDNDCCTLTTKTTPFSIRKLPTSTQATRSIHNLRIGPPC